MYSILKWNLCVHMDSINHDSISMSSWCENDRNDASGEVANQDIHLPGILPKMPGRFYFLFGKPIETEGMLLVSISYLGFRKPLFWRICLTLLEVVWPCYHFAMWREETGIKRQRKVSWIVLRSEVGSWEMHFLLERKERKWPLPESVFKANLSSN